MANVTILDVAAAAGVSKTTASDVLRGADASYRPKTVEHVRKIAQDLGYQASGAARLLRQNNTNIIGIAVGVRQRPYLNSLVVAVHDACIKRGFQPALFEPYHLLPQQGYSPFPSPDMLAGILSIDLSMDQKLPHFYAKLQDRLPIVALYNVESVEINSVATDWAAGIEMATKHLVELGHQRIAYAHDPASAYYTDRVRHERWLQCIAKYDLKDTTDCSVVYSTPSFQANVGEKLVNAPSAVPSFVQQVTTRLTQMPKPPSAIICTSDELAMALVGKLSEKGWRLPKDLSIVGFYGMDFGAYCFPALTTIAQPLDQTAPAALDRLTELIDAKKNGTALSPQQILLKPQLCVRKSTSLN